MTTSDFAREANEASSIYVGVVEAYHGARSVIQQTKAILMMWRQLPEAVNCKPGYFRRGVDAPKKRGKQSPVRYRVVRGDEFDRMKEEHIDLFIKPMADRGAALANALHTMRKSQWNAARIASELRDIDAPPLTLGQHTARTAVELVTDLGQQVLRCALRGFDYSYEFVPTGSELPPDLADQFYAHLKLWSVAPYKDHDLRAFDAVSDSFLDAWLVRVKTEGRAAEQVALTRLDAARARAEEAKKGTTRQKIPRPTTSDLLDAGGIGDDTFRRIRTRSGLKGVGEGAPAHFHQWSAEHVRKLMVEVGQGRYRERTRMLREWEKWSLD